MLYDFECESCHKVFESLSQPWDPVRCPHCLGQKCKRLPPAPKAIGISSESKEMSRREGKRERVSKIYEKQGIKL